MFFEELQISIQCFLVKGNLVYILLRVFIFYFATSPSLIKKRALIIQQFPKMRLKPTGKTAVFTYFNNLSILTTNSTLISIMEYEMNSWEF